MLTPREKSLYRKMSPEEDQTRDVVDSVPKLYQRAIPAPVRVLKAKRANGKVQQQQQQKKTKFGPSLSVATGR